MCNSSLKRSVVLPLFLAVIVAFCGSFVSAVTIDRDLNQFAEQQNGFMIGGQMSGDGFGYVVGTGGDVNGDSIDDILTFAPQSNNILVMYGDNNLF